MRLLRALSKIVSCCAMLAALSSEARAQFTCGQTSVTMNNPSSQTSYVWQLANGTAYHGKMSLQASTNGMLNVALGVPNEVSGPATAFWPYDGWGYVNGPAIQIIMPPQAGISSQAWYFEGSIRYDGTFGGGSGSGGHGGGAGTITIDAAEYTKGGANNVLHNNIGRTFSAFGLSGANPPTISGSVIPCASSAPPTFNSTFNYNLEVSNSWYTGTVAVNQQSGAYVEMTLSDPHDGFGGWNGHATCVIDTNSFLLCTLQTGQVSVPGDPLWTMKLVASPYYYYGYGASWQNTSTGQYIDFWGF